MLKYIGCFWNPARSQGVRGLSARAAATAFFLPEKSNLVRLLQVIMSRDGKVCSFLVAKKLQVFY